MFVCPICSNPITAKILMCKVCEKDIFDINNDLGAKTFPIPHGTHKKSLDVYASRPYHGIVKAVILALKYQRDPHMADLIIKAFRPPQLHFENAILCPVPLHPRRLLARTYNQSTEIATRIARTSPGAEVLHLLKRTRATQPQGKKNPSQRTRNVANCFSVNARHAKSATDRTIILIDDVCTSGATLVECAKVLYAHAGATDVQAYVLAMANKKIVTNSDFGIVGCSL